MGWGGCSVFAGSGMLGEPLRSTVGDDASAPAPPSSALPAGTPPFVLASKAETMASFRRARWSCWLRSAWAEAVDASAMSDKVLAHAGLWKQNVVACRAVGFTRVVRNFTAGDPAGASGSTGSTALTAISAIAAMHQARRQRCPDAGG